MALSCLFDHRWKGCTCERCGKQNHRGKQQYEEALKKRCERDTRHKHEFKDIPGTCDALCSACGKKKPSPKMEKHETAKENHLNVYEYLKYLFEQLPNMTSSEIGSVCPWSDSLPDHVKVPTAYTP